MMYSLLFWVMVFVYPVIVFSFMVYFIGFPLLFTGSFWNMCLQLLFVFSVMVSIVSSFASSCTCMLFGLIPSWLWLSFQCFITSISVCSGSCVFMIVSPLYVVVYPVVVPISMTVYFIVFPLSFAGRLVYVCFQLLFVFRVIGVPVVSPFASSCTCMLFGLIPSWLLLSSHTLFTVMLVFAGA